MTSLVSLRGIQKTYDGKQLVVKNLDLEVSEGEFLTLLGPSGSGKTTVLMMLAGFETPTTGEIVIAGQHMTRLPPQKRGIGMVFQNYALFPNMSVAENLAFPLEVRKLPAAELRDRVEKSLAMVRLTPFADRRPSQLSGGQQQRVALARALIFEPRLVLMDEPLGALDKNLREQMQYEIKQIHARLGVTVVYVTHDQSEALTMSDRVAVFNDGIIQQICPPKELYERPANSFVAGFIGENNRLQGVVRKIIDDECLVEIAPGVTVKARKVGVHATAEPTTLSIRPERVRISPKAGEVDTVIAGEVESVLYHGDHIRAHLRGLGPAPFVVKLPNTNGAAATLVAGASVSIGWASRDCLALDMMEA
jgi:putative spermidine/putrescine transport system ATP-binding protein